VSRRITILGPDTGARAKHLTSEEYAEICERLLTALDGCAACGQVPFGSLARAAREIGICDVTVRQVVVGKMISAGTMLLIRDWLDKREAAEEAARP